MTLSATLSPPSWKATLPTQWLDRLGLIGCLLLPWLLIVTRGGSDAIGVAIAVMFLIRSWQKRDWSWLENPVIRTCLLAWCWMLLASPFAWSMRESLSVAGPWIRWMLFYAAMTTWVLVPRQHLKLCALNIAFMLVLTIIDTIWQYYTGLSLTGHVPNENYRLTGPMDNVKVGIFIAKLCFPACAILIYLSMQFGSRKHLAASLTLLAISIATVFLSGERTASFTCLLAIAITTLTIALTEPALRVKTLLASTGLIIAFLLMLITQPVLQDRLAYLSTNITHFAQSPYGQLDYIGYQIGMDHLAHGAGFKGFRELCPEYMARDNLTHCNIHPHNPYVEWFAEMGLPGLLMFLAIIASLALQAFRAVLSASGPGRVMAAISLSVLAMHFFPFMATQSFFSNWPALLLWYSISVAMACLNMLKCPSEKTTA